MHFKDPTLQYNFRIPLGWVYDWERSHLITVIFRRWDRDDETLSVRAMPSFAPPDASLDEWHAALEELAFPPRMLPATRVWAGSLPAALVETHDPDPSPVHRRILIVRGSRLDITLEHRTPEPSSGPRLSEVLRVVGESMVVPTNLFLPEPVSQDAVLDDLMLAQEAIQRQAWAEAVPAASRALLAAQAMYLYTVVANTPLPEIPAVLVQIHAAFRLAQATGSVLFLRDAEHLALRALYTLERLPFVNPQRKRQLHSELLQGLEAVASLQVSIAGDGGTSQRVPPSPGAGLANLRLDYLLEQARTQLTRGEPTSALKQCEAATADLLIVLHGLPQRFEAFDPQHLDPQLVEKYRDSGANTSDQMKELSLQLATRARLEDLTETLRLLADLRQMADDFTGAAEANQFLMPILEQLGQPLELSFGGALRPPSSLSTAQAQGLIGQASSLADIGDPSSLEEAQRLLDEAEAMVTEADQPALLAHLCLVRASVLHAERNLDGALQVINRGLKAAAQQPEKSAATVQELKTIQSQFLLNAGDAEAARRLAQEVVSAPEGDTLREVRNRAAHYLNLGIIDMQRGDFAAAASSLHQAVVRVVSVAPFSEAAYRILMVAARLFSDRSPAEQDLDLSRHLNLAALANLDARYARIPTDAARTGFDESGLHRQAYEDLIQRLIDAGEWAEAASVADRSRARSLNRLIAPPAGGGSETLLEMPAVSQPGELDQNAAFWRAGEAVIAQADAEISRQGVFRPLDADELQRVVRETGCACLFIQPVNGRIALLVIQPSGEIQVVFSPQPYRQVLDTLEQFIGQVDRFQPEDGQADPAGQKAAHQALEVQLSELWLGLIAPVHDLIGSGQPLIIVPYRELILVPYALLRDPQGEAVIEHHPLSVTPSLATLSALRAQGAWPRKAPGKAYVAGDPAFNQRFRLRRLPAARAEAEAVAHLLGQVMGAGAALQLRLEADAHEDSYRREALGCDLVHLSCHAQLVEPAYLSRLILAPNGPQDGLLMAAEASDVKLKDALVFLGACKTGRGQVTADGVVGLGRAFLEAGARAVVLSLWKVQDEATHALTTHFYQSLFAAGAQPSAAHALQHAMLETRADLRAGRILVNGQALEDHPHYWAPFFILGDGFAVRYTQED